MTYDEFMAEFPDITRDVAQVHELTGTMPRKHLTNLLLTLADERTKRDLVGGAVALLLALADAQAELAKTGANFEEYAEIKAEETKAWRERLADAQAEIDRLNALVSEVTS
jgi:vacuolar-type H+-ATPase subunit I/STV1